MVGLDDPHRVVERERLAAAPQLLQRDVGQFDHVRRLAATGKTRWPGLRSRVERSAFSNENVRKEYENEAEADEWVLETCIIIL